jgi:hypothetical protein
MATLIDELLLNEAYDRQRRLPLVPLTHIERIELVRFVDDTCNGDPRCDFASYLCDGLADMPMIERPHVNTLIRKLLLGVITIEEQAHLNALSVRAMLQCGIHEVRAALEKARAANASTVIDEGADLFEDCTCDGVTECAHCRQLRSHR